MSKQMYNYFTIWAALQQRYDDSIFFYKLNVGKSLSLLLHPSMKYNIKYITYTVEVLYYHCCWWLFLDSSLILETLKRMEE